MVGRVYEYFLSKFAIAEGKGKGEFYTPKSIVNLIAELIEPYKGKIYDPCCGSGGMFVQSMKFIENHKGNKKDVSVYGQEYTSATYKLAKMNLAIRGISANLGAAAKTPLLMISTKLSKLILLWQTHHLTRKTGELTMS